MYKEKMKKGGKGIFPSENIKKDVGQIPCGSDYNYKDNMESMDKQIKEDLKINRKK